MLLTAGLTQVLPGSSVNTEFGGNLSFGAKLVVLATPGCLVSVSGTASITGLVEVLVQLAPAGQLGSPPPVTVAVLALGLMALAATATGTVMMMSPVTAPAAMVQPTKLAAPVAGHPLKVPPVATMAPLVVMPLGNTSATVMGAVVGPLATLILMVYVCAGAPTTNTAGVAVLVTVNTTSALIAFITSSVPKAARTAPVTEVSFIEKLSKVSDTESNNVSVRTVTLVTPAGMVMMPLAGTAIKVVPLVLYVCAPRSAGTVGLVPLPAVVKVTVTGTALGVLKVMVLSTGLPSATVFGAAMVITGKPVPSTMVPVAGAGFDVAPLPPVTVVMAAVKFSVGSLPTVSVSVGTLNTPVV